MQQVIMWIMAAGAVIGGLDRIFGNRLRLGEKFEEGFRLLGPIALSMAGILCLAPLLADGVRWLAAPLCAAIGLDASVFAGILAIDMGGYPMAMELAQDVQTGAFSGIVIAAIFGCTITFTIPVGMGMLEGEDRGFFARGILFGLIAMPVALVAGGVMCGLSVGRTLWQLTPILLLSAVLLIGVWKWTEKTIRAFTWFAAAIKTIITLGLIAGAVQYMTGLSLVPGLAPLEEAMAVVASIGMVLLGSLPAAELLRRALKKPLNLLGSKIGLNSVSMAGFLMTPVSVLPTLALFKEMDRRGKIANVAAAVCSTSMISAHLAYTLAEEPGALGALLVTKLAGALLGAALALWATRKEA